VRVVKSVWYCKHIGIAFVTTSSCHLLFWDGLMDRKEAMLWSFGRSVSCTKLSNHWFSTGFLAYVYIATLRPTDIGRQIARTDQSSGLSSRRPVVF